MDAARDDKEWRGRLSCSVCLDCCGGSNASWSALPCGHVFHETCIDRALQAKSSCPVCRASFKQNKNRLPLSLYVNNEVCSPLHSSGASQTLLSGVDLDYSEERRKFKEKLQENAKHVEELEGRNASTQEELARVRTEVQDKKKQLSRLEKMYEDLEHQQKDATERLAQKTEELLQFRNKEELLKQKMKDMHDEHAKTLHKKESEIVCLKNEKKRAMWARNRDLTYEEIMGMMSTAEETGSPLPAERDGLARALAERNAELLKLEARVAALDKEKKQVATDAALREADLKRTMQAQMDCAFKERDSERLVVNHLESKLSTMHEQLAATQEQLTSVKQQLEAQGEVLEDALQTAGQGILQMQPRRPRSRLQAMIQLGGKHAQRQQQLPQPSHGALDGCSQSPWRQCSEQHTEHQQQQCTWAPRGGSDEGQQEEDSTAGLDMLARLEEVQQSGHGREQLYAEPRPHLQPQQQQQQQRLASGQGGGMPSQAESAEYMARLGSGAAREWQLGRGYGHGGDLGGSSASGGAATGMAGEEGMCESREEEEDGEGDDCDDDGGALGVPEVPGRLRIGGTGSSTSQRQHWQQQQQQQQQQQRRRRRALGMTSRPAGGLLEVECLQDVSNTTGALQPQLPNICSARGGAGMAGGQCHVAIPCTSAGVSLLGLHTRKPSFAGSNAANGSRAGFAQRQPGSGSLVREGPDGKGGIKRHLVTADMANSSRGRSPAGPSSFVGAKLPYTSLGPAAKKQRRMDMFVTRQ